MTSPAGPGAIAFVNGELIPRADATISIDDAAVRYGAACFETMRAANGRVFRLTAHLERLQAGLAAMGVAAPRTSELEAALTATLEANALLDARVRLSVSAGRLDGPDLRGADRASVVVVADPVAVPPAGGLPPPLRLAVSSFRVDPGRPLAFAKTAQYLVYLLARAEARDAGADEALLVNVAGEVCETATANIFALIDGALVTPDAGSGPLPGVTRSVLLEIAARDERAVEERALSITELARAAEVFTTSSVVGVQPVTAIDRDGEPWWRRAAPGPVTSDVAEAYAHLLATESAEGRGDG